MTEKKFMITKKSKKILQIIILVIISLSIIVSIVLASTNIYIVSSAKERILTSDEALKLEDIDCIVVLGCLVRPDGSPSDMLYDRLDAGTSLYLGGAAPKLLMSGDHGRKNYDEVNNMKKFAVELGIPSEDVFMDHAGFSTYDSIYRAKNIFQCKKIIIVTQEYHLYRAMYIADKLGMEAYGVPSDPRGYAGQFARDIREIAARTKDFFMVAFDAKPVYSGDPIPISGNGDLSNG